MPGKRSAGIALFTLVLLLSCLTGALAAGQSASEVEPAGGETPLAVARALTRGEGVALPEEPGLRVQVSDERGVVLELVTPSFELVDGKADENACQTLHVPGYGSQGQPGIPNLPGYSALLGVPPGASLRLEVLDADASLVSGQYDLCPVPRLLVEAHLDGSISYQGQVARRDPERYGVDAFYPGSLAQIVPAGQIRSQDVAQVRLYPFRYNPVSGQLVHWHRIRVRIEWGGAATTAPAREAVVEDPSFDQLLLSVLLNGDVARRWRVAPAPSQGSDIPALASPAVKILVDRTGIYRVDRNDLAGVGLDVSALDPRTLQVRSGGQEIAIYIDGESDGSFDPGDYMLFYGEGVDTPYTDTNVYWLTWGGGHGLRMSSRDGTPGGGGAAARPFTHTVHVEQDHAYNSSVPPGADKDHWFWDLVFANGAPAALDYTLPTIEVATEPVSATIRGWLAGFEDMVGVSPDHHTEIYFNGHLVDDARWEGQIEYSFEVQVPHSYLAEGDNVLTVRCPCDLGLSRDVVYTNWFEIDYPRTYTVTSDELYFDNQDAGLWEYHLPGFVSADVALFDITDANGVGRIVGGWYAGGTLTFEDTVAAETKYMALGLDRYLSPVEILVDTPSDLHSTTNQAEYLLITHGSFYTDVLTLDSHRAAQGLRTMTVNVQDIYDEFNGGVFDPHAIQRFLAYAYANWTPPAPAYVLLVGDGSLDFKDNLGTGDPNLIPPYLAAVDPWINETATDNRYVCVSGDDPFPDMHIGRLPVRTAAEASAVVHKILEYEMNPPAGDWSRQVLFVADNEDPDGDFAWLSDAIADHYVPPPYLVDKVYYKITHPDISTTRAALLSAVNEGRLLVNYIGHASYQWWAHERLFQVSDIASLSNGSRLPVMTPMTCYDGFFHAPGIPSLGESLVRAEGRGAIASWSPTGLGVALGHDYLNRGLYEAILGDDVAELGPATTLAKLYLYSHSGSYWDLLDTYLLFGDPALRLNVLDADVGIAMTISPTTPLQPGDPLTYTLSISNAGPAIAHHVVVTDLMPAFATDSHVVSAGLALTQRPGAPFTWDVEDLVPGQSGVIVLRATVTGAAGTGTFESEAWIATSARETGILPNRATASSVVVAGPAAAVRLDANPPQIWIDGPASTISAHVQDAWGNPVADGIPVSFATSLGTVAPASATTTSGVATTWLTAGRVAGTAVVTATVNGIQDTTQITILAAPATRLWLPLIVKHAVP